MKKFFYQIFSLAILFSFVFVKPAEATVYSCGDDALLAHIDRDVDTCDCEGTNFITYEVTYFQDICLYPPCYPYTLTHQCCGFTKTDSAFEGDVNCFAEPPDVDEEAYCGDSYTDDRDCNCANSATMTDGRTCCGWVNGSGADETCSATELIDIDIDPDAETFDSLNPLKIASGDADLSTPGGIISKAMNSFIFPIAGMILFLMLVLGGFQMLVGATNSKALEEGKQRVTTAIIGFILLFASYWIVQLIELIFGLNILGG